MNRAINIFKSGVHNLFDVSVIPNDSAQDSKNWLTQDGRIKLAGGRKTLGAEGAVGKAYGIHKGIKKGGYVLYRKVNTAIQYYDDATLAWVDVITGLGETDDYSFANYSSLAGDFTFANGASGYFKLNNANPSSYIDLYDPAKNFKGWIIIDRGRTILWRREAPSRDYTGLYGSKIDPQNSTVYTAVTNEAIGVLGSKTYTGTLAFKAGGAKRNCFGTSFEATVVAGTETFTDNFNGTLTSNLGGTGTINYITGAYSITFSANTTGAVTSDYQWEDSTAGGIADFTKSATRLAGEGFQFPQDEGGDSIQNVLVGQDGAYYSLKEKSAYRLSLDADDLGATNEVYRKNIGILNWRAAVSTELGIVFINTANPEKPEMTMLTRNVLGEVEPKVLMPHFKFSNYSYDDCSLDTYERYITIACKTADADNNDTILMANISGKTVDIVEYEARCFLSVDGYLLVGSPLSQTIYYILNGYDDLDLSVENQWIGKDDDYGVEDLKKIRRLRFQGMITPDQRVEISLGFDNDEPTVVGTIYGNETYVDAESPQTIGANMIGKSVIGGDDTQIAFPFYMEMKLKCPKFKTRTLKIEAKGIGYVDFNMIEDWDILRFENRIPKKYRIKQ
jgi:hypothetical protein